jgi:MoxR-like ATPase
MSEPTFAVVQPLPADYDWERHAAELPLARLTATRPPPDLGDHREGARAYRPDAKLITAVNAAIHLRAPLLVTGEPGTGKTQLAYFLAEYFRIDIFPYTVRSTSTALDLRYAFDAVGDLREAYLARAEGRAEGRADAQPQAPTAPAPSADPAARNPNQDRRMHHIVKGPLWQAFEHGRTRGQACILLIDEIDKAPRDFPNDLLQELQEKAFPHPFNPDAAHAIRADAEHLPIVVITSNRERRLPDAFLRRCIVHDIDLDDDLIDKAVDAHAAAFRQLAPALRQVAVERFRELRRVQRLSRRPGIAELLAWLVTLSRTDQQLGGRPIGADTLKNAPLIDLPHLHCLVKIPEDLALIAQQGRR